MTLLDIENAQRVDAAAWATANGLQLLWGNTGARNPHDVPSVVWRFRPADQARLTGQTVLHRGVTEASVYLPAGSGAIAALALAESLQALFRGRVYAGSVTLDESVITVQGRDGSSFVVSVAIPWEWDETRIPQGAIGLYETPGALVAYQSLRQLWEIHVRAPLSLTTFFDSDPPATASPPFAVARFRTLSPIAVELSTLRVPGRVLAAIHHPIGSGHTAHEAAVDNVVRTFDELTYRGVFFGTTLVSRSGRTPINTWQTTVRLPFYYEVRT